MATKQLGRVTEIFIPENDSIDDIQTIGFKIQIGEKEISMIEEQNEQNIHIYKDDFVFVIQHTIDSKTFYDIELLKENEQDEF